MIFVLIASPSRSSAAKYALAEGLKKDEWEWLDPDGTYSTFAKFNSTNAIVVSLECPRWPAYLGKAVARGLPVDFMCWDSRHLRWLAKFDPSKVA